MRLITAALLLLLSLGCAVEDPITEQEVISKVHQFFELLDVDNYDSKRILREVTEDFRIFELGDEFSWEQFDEVLAPFMRTMELTDWELSHFKVAIDVNSAHTSYHNKGTFISSDGTETHSKWLESIYLVREDNRLKLAFLQSELIKREVIPGS